MLTEIDKTFLLTLARRSVTAAASGTTAPPVKEQSISTVCSEPGAAFVTIYENGILRGCIGYVVPVKPLYQTVLEVARKAALDDPRFLPVGCEELPRLTISVSVLSPLRKIHAIEEICVGTHGIVLQRGHAKGLLLPKVAVEYGWDRIRFLDETAIKAGLPRKAWKDPGVEIFLFTAEEFSERDIVEVA